MHSLVHEHLARATSRDHAERVARHPVARPPGRLRLQAARSLATLAGRLDCEQARRALARQG